MSVRKMRLERALEKVLRIMNLRRPQKEALSKLHSIFVHLDRDISELSIFDLSRKVKELYPNWIFPATFPQTTIALATGVGKTRLMGAIAAYLYLSGQSEHFLFLAPRSTILRKLTTEAHPGSLKYLFVDPSLVPEPKIWHSGNVESFDPNKPPGLFGSGPHVYVFSPQSFTGDNRRVFTPSDFSGTSLGKYLRERKDLVVLFDESHHLGDVGRDETQAWTQSIRNLTPSFLIGMTATQRTEDGVNLLHQYDLATCLHEKLYTKDVAIIVDERPSAITSDEDWDHTTLDFALDRLKRKARAVVEYDQRVSFPSINPVLLVCAENTTHADQVAKWLKANRAFSDDQLLVTHSGRSKSELEIQRLVGIERPDSKVRVVINVFELTEGWDVTNVYVIAPLRSLGTFQGAVQTLGRGLRLPAGYRVGDDELDTLDVLCFGRLALSEILSKARKTFGHEEDEDLSLQVKSKDDPEYLLQEPTKVIRVLVSRPVCLLIPHATRVPVEPDLDFDMVSRRRIDARTASEFRLGFEDLSGTVEKLKYGFDSFVVLAASRVLTDLRYLSEPLHRDKIQHIIRSFLTSVGQTVDEPVSLDWILVAEAVKAEIEGPYRKKPVEFRITSRSTPCSFEDFDWRVPESFNNALAHIDIKEWTSLYKRLPFGGWRRCLHQESAFDSGPEYALALILDQSPTLDWWVRNDPAKFKIASPIGFFEPDFLAEINEGDKVVRLIIEIKQSLLWTPADSNARVKSRAAFAWCKAVNACVSDAVWEHWVILDVDLEACNTLRDLERVRFVE